MQFDYSNIYVFLELNLKRISSNTQSQVFQISGLKFLTYGIKNVK